MAHFSRKCYSTVKQQLESIAGYNPLILSEMDTVFMGSYAAGNIISGKLGDTFNPTTVLAIGLFGSGACLFMINVSLWFDFLALSLTLGNFFIIAVYFLFGFFQSTGGPVGEFVRILVRRERRRLSKRTCQMTTRYQDKLVKLTPKVSMPSQEPPSWATGSATRSPSRTGV